MPEQYHINSFRSIICHTLRFISWTSYIILKQSWGWKLHVCKYTWRFVKQAWRDWKFPLSTLNTIGCSLHKDVLLKKQFEKLGGIWTWETSFLFYFENLPRFLCCQSRLVLTACSQFPKIFKKHPSRSPFFLNITDLQNCTKNWL